MTTSPARAALPGSPCGKSSTQRRCQVGELETGVSTKGGVAMLKLSPLVSAAWREVRLVMVLQRFWRTGRRDRFFRTELCHRLALRPVARLRLQAAVRKRLERRRFVRARMAVVDVQRCVRGFLACQVLRRTRRATLLLQRWWRAALLNRVYPSLHVERSPNGRHQNEHRRYDVSVLLKRKVSMSKRMAAILDWRLHSAPAALNPKRRVIASRFDNGCLSASVPHYEAALAKPVLGTNGSQYRLSRLQSALSVSSPRRRRGDMSEPAPHDEVGLPKLELPTNGRPRLTSAEMLGASPSRVRRHGLGKNPGENKREDGVHSCLLLGSRSIASGAVQDEHDRIGSVARVRNSNVRREIMTASTRLWVQDAIACSSIQRWWRHSKQRIAIRDRIAARRTARRKLQAALRGLLAKQRLDKMRLAIRVIQRSFRRGVFSQGARRRSVGAATIQRWWRQAACCKARVTAMAAQAELLALKVREDARQRDYMVVRLFGLGQNATARVSPDNCSHQRVKDSSYRASYLRSSTEACGRQELEALSNAEAESDLLHDDAAAAATCDPDAQSPVRSSCKAATGWDHVTEAETVVAEALREGLLLATDGRGAHAGGAGAILSGLLKQLPNARDEGHLAFAVAAGQHAAVFEALRATLGGARAERFLWHGTSWSSVANILRRGFNRAYAGRHGTRFGLGTYFAADVDYALRFCGRSTAAGAPRALLLARVLVGRYTKGARGLVEPPLLEDTASSVGTRSTSTGGQRYDSTVDDCEHPRVFCVFRDFQALPIGLVVLD